MDISEAWAAGGWISFLGLACIIATHLMAPVLTIWLLPVALPMVIAPVLIWWTSRTASPSAFPVPEDTTIPPILTRHNAVLAAWSLTAPTANVTPMAEAKLG